MNRSAAVMVIEQYGVAHQHALTIAESLSDDALRMHSPPLNQSIAFHLWHMARWADHLQASLPGMTVTLADRLDPGEQIWEREDLAAQWGLDAAALGFAETGMTMGDDVAAALPMPKKNDLLTYVRAAFARADELVAQIDEEQFLMPELPQALTEGIWDEGSVGDAILTHITHDNRHLGMIECLNSIYSGSGTATV